MERSFAFVDGTQVDPNTRKLIRSHVMKGKNAGKTLHRSSRLELPRRAPADFRALQCIPRVTEMGKGTVARRPPRSIAISRSLGGPMLTLSFPFEFTPHSLEVVHQFFLHVLEKLYPPRLSISPDEARTVWLGVLFSDEAATHCSLALIEACNGFFLGGGTSSPEALYHLSQAFTLVKKRLESEDALSDSTLGIILMLVIQEQIRRQDREADVHFAGLEKMIYLRGGMCQLERNLPLLLKICKTDITYALQNGRSVNFFRDRMAEVQVTLSLQGFNFDRSSIASAIRPPTLDPYLYEILLDATSLAHLVNSIHSTQTLGVIEFEEILVSICSRLIQFHPLLSAQQLSDIDAAYHIGLTVFMMSLFLQHDRRRILHYDLVSLRLRELFDCGLDKLDDNSALWLASIAGIWISGDDDGSWLPLRLTTLAQRLGIERWEDVYSSVSTFPWIKALHDQLGRAVWNLA